MKPNHILIIYGHPVKDAFSENLLKNYSDGVAARGAETRIIKLQELDFDLNLSGGDREGTEMESALKDAQADILWADHIVFIFPNWWASFPALVKGFIDRTFLPGFAFKYNKGSKGWVKLLKGKSARIIITMDDTVWRYKFIYGSPGLNAIKRGVLQYCGIKPVRSTLIGPIKHSSEKQRQQWLKKVKRLGEKLI